MREGIDARADSLRRQRDDRLAARQSRAARFRRPESLRRGGVDLAALDPSARLRRRDAASAVQRRRRQRRSGRCSSVLREVARAPAARVRAASAHARQHRPLRPLARCLPSAQVAMLPPQGYLEMLGLMSGATLVLTDSGGMQEETTALGVPCLTLRENTERPITIDQGTNTLVGARPRRDRARRRRHPRGPAASAGACPELWDGHAAERIAADLGAGSRIARARWRRRERRIHSDDARAASACCRAWRWLQCADDRRRGLFPGLGVRALHPAQPNGTRATAASSATST